MINLKEGIKNVLAVILGLFIITLIISTVIDMRDKMKTSENTITVSDSGVIYAKPDLGLITVAVVTEARIVTEAMTENTKRMNTIISGLKEQGVEEKDLQTISFNIQPRYEWREASHLHPQGQRVLVGYEVIQNLQVKIRNLEKIGSLIQIATDGGANQISDLQLTIDNPDALRAKAREKAINEAKNKAEELAKQLGVRLVRISSFSESGVTPFYVQDSRKEAAPMVEIMGGEVVQIEGGENRIEVTVHLTYQIR